ncbi:MAG: N-acetylmuramoyl-L-alanine amidase [Burkholderiaceae bacterium]|nr:N-acetylmuramoyl-L-alanine amidase [Burkholderiaceae bacterium]
MRTITVTAGHGEGDPGATYAGYTEAELMADLRDRVAAHLRDMGHEVRQDGIGRVNRALTYAMHLIAGSACAIELHTNAAANPAASGVEVIALPAQRAQAQRLARAIAGVLRLPLRGMGGWIDQSMSARGRLGFVARGGMVAEVFFLSNPEDLLSYSRRRDEVALAIAEAVA